MLTATARTARPGRPGPALVPAPTTARLPLPAPAWTQWHDVLVPGPEGTLALVDAVVLGPTGVHVLTRRERGDEAPWGPDDARAAATAVRAALPGRYRGVVTAALTDEGAGDGAVVDGVVVATTSGLVEAVRLRPRVLSRSETGVLAATLSRVLVPQVADAPRTGWWGRLARRSRAPRSRAA